MIRCMVSSGSSLAWRTAIAAGTGGLVLGGLTLALQGVLPGSSNRLANSGAVWVIGAFAAGVMSRKNRCLTWLAGTAVLLGAVPGYYGSMVVFEHGEVSQAVLSGPLGWSAVALASGPVFATAGSWWRGDRLGRRVASLCLLGGVFLAEGGYLLVSHRPAGEAVILSSIGVLIPLALGRSAQERLYGLAALAPAAAVGLGGYVVLSRVMDVAFTRGG
jgi:hypothetical protein